MNLLDIACQKFVKEEFGDDASALVSKLIDLGDATFDDLMLATDMLRQEVDKVITTLVQHNVCSVNEPTAPQQVDMKPLSFSLNMNATLARPGKVALKNAAMRAFGGKGVDITKAVYDNGRMTLDSMVKDGLDGPVCYSMIESGYLVPVHAYPVIVISDGNDDQEMQVSTVFYALNFRKFNLHLLGTTLEIFATKAMDPIATRVIATLFKNTWLQNNREQAMTHDNLEDALLSDPTLGFVALHLGQDMATRRRLLCEGLTLCLRDLEVDGIIQAPVGEYGPDVKYTLSLAPLWALMKQRYAEAEIETALDCALLQIVRVLMVGDALSAKEIQRRAMLLKRETWTRLLMLTKMEYVEPDIPIKNVNSIGCDDYYDTGGDGHDDERVWRIRLDKMYAMMVMFVYGKIARLKVKIEETDILGNDDDEDRIEEIVYAYGMTLVFRDVLSDE